MVRTHDALTNCVKLSQSKVQDNGHVEEMIQGDAWNGMKVHGARAPKSVREKRQKN